MDYTEYAQPWSQEQRRAVKLPTRANSRFFYKQHPRNWELWHFETEQTSGKRTTRKLKPVWLPVLSTHHETAGVNGTRSTSNGVDSSLSRTRLADDGWHVLRPDQHDYLRQYPCRNGFYWTDKFTLLENLGGDLVTTFDYQGYAEWRRELMVKGVLPLPHQTFLKRITQLVSKRISRISRDQHIPEIAAKLKALQDLQTDMNAATANVKKEGVKHYEL
jgi:hypothetical protein